jgi:hypothetical protein
VEPSYLSRAGWALPWAAVLAAAAETVRRRAARRPSPPTVSALKAQQQQQQLQGGAQRSKSSHGQAGTRRCRFFAAGRCRNGDSYPFGHEAEGTSRSGGSGATSKPLEGEPHMSALGPAAGVGSSSDRAARPCAAAAEVAALLVEEGQPGQRGRSHPRRRRGEAEPGVARSSALAETAGADWTQIGDHGLEIEPELAGRRPPLARMEAAPMPSAAFRLPPLQLRTAEWC